MIKSEFQKNVYDKKVQRYSIRKFTVGTASIVIGGLIFLGTGSDALAEEVNISTETNPPSTAIDIVRTENVQGITQHGNLYFHSSDSDNVSHETMSTITLSLVDSSGALLPLTDGKYVAEGEGKYYVDNDFREVIFEPQPDFVGTASGVYIELTNNAGTKSRTYYVPTVTAVIPTAEAVTSSDIQGHEQSGYPVFTPGNGQVPLSGEIVLLNAQHQVVTEGVVDAIGDQQQKVGEYYINEEGAVVYKPTDLTYTGSVQPVIVQTEDVNGTIVSTTYTPSIIPIISHTEAATSQGIQGKPQQGTPIFHENTVRLNGEERSIPMSQKVAPILVDNQGQALPLEDGQYIAAEGVYELSTQGTVTFIPYPQFTGTASPVFVEKQTISGVKIRAAYTPTVIAVTPVLEPAESSAIQGEIQSGTPKFTPGHVELPLKQNSFKLLKHGEAVDTITNILGQYTIDNATGTVTYIPKDKRYARSLPAVFIQAEDINGTKVMTTYRPHLIAVKPTGEAVTSTGRQGEQQTGQPVFYPGKANINDEEKQVPLDHSVLPQLVSEDGYGLMLIDNQYKVIGEGSYSIDSQGVVTFVPEAQFIGTAKGIYVERRDLNGITVKAKYTPTVVAVEPQEEAVITPETPSTRDEVVAPNQSEETSAPSTESAPQESVPPVKTEEAVIEPETPSTRDEVVAPNQSEETTTPSTESAPQESVPPVKTESAVVEPETSSTKGEVVAPNQSEETSAASTESAPQESVPPVKTESAVVEPETPSTRDEVVAPNQSEETSAPSTESAPQESVPPVKTESAVVEPETPPTRDEVVAPNQSEETSAASTESAPQESVPPVKTESAVVEPETPSTKGEAVAPNQSEETSAASTESAPQESVPPVKTESAVVEPETPSTKGEAVAPNQSEETTTPSAESAPQESVPPVKTEEAVVEPETPSTRDEVVAPNQSEETSAASTESAPQESVPPVKTEEAVIEPETPSTKDEEASSQSSREVKHLLQKTETSMSIIWLSCKLENSLNIFSVNVKEKSVAYLYIDTLRYLQ